MTRFYLSVPLCLTLLLAACMEAGPTSGTTASDGVAQKLSLGVTKAEAEVALGVEAGFERNPKNFDEECLSYAYGDGKYVHAVYRGGKLVQRSDGHRALCTYGTLVSS